MMPNLNEKRSRGKAQYFIEKLGNDITLDMVLIRPGSFLMGAPEDEEGKSEGPQHLVTIPQFFMGKYPVTQVQWRTVAAMPEIDRQLEPHPSLFKGEYLPVHNISWYEATEFCNRLSAHTKRHYRLPSEAEWEYACRAGTITPFHFGQTISSKYANYNASKAYDNGVEGEHQDKITPVGYFKVANNFGLYDMHGNVLEWCTDHWHDNYEGAPTDGSAWTTGGNSNGRVLRGGCWHFEPNNCRSGYRDYSFPDRPDLYFGFRVVYSASRSQ